MAESWPSGEVAPSGMLRMTTDAAGNVWTLVDLPSWTHNCTINNESGSNIIVAYRTVGGDGGAVDGDDHYVTILPWQSREFPMTGPARDFNSRTILDIFVAGTVASALDVVVESEERAR